ncbi:hypothetical protein B0T18DRAFT_416542 [Schizothecium vesticola]|uniref:Uncharacterized protein n=1 Tax=Schizothecium vesticola TaxID=314040 RepID=A0AA40ERD5_9PEZI|nr:hypothetical protein B0T18DRAFT_416542 [Schizothecium vesticola]
MLPPTPVQGGDIPPAARVPPSTPRSGKQHLVSHQRSRNLGCPRDEAVHSTTRGQLQE